MVAKPILNCTPSELAPLRVQCLLKWIVRKTLSRSRIYLDVCVVLEPFKIDIISASVILTTTDPAITAKCNMHNSILEMQQPVYYVT
jgi:hypothetical protein